MVNFAPLFDGVVYPFLLAILLGLASWVATRVASALKLNLDNAAMQSVENALQNGISYGMHKVQVIVDKNTTLDVKNQVVAAALTYVIPKVTDELKQLGIDPAGLADRLLARLPTS